jgi:GNAT superfamily N-acetyltransferase
MIRTGALPLRMGQDSTKEDKVITGRELQRDEVGAVGSIDRSELIENIYTLADGVLVMHPERYDMRGWPAGEAEAAQVSLLECYEHGGWLYGLLDEDRLVGVADLDNRFIGPHHNLLQLKFLHVACSYRDGGLGRRLFEMARRLARQKGAAGLYISATPSEHTINFYLGLGCRPVSVPDPELWALEPEDIHLECAV